MAEHKISWVRQHDSMQCGAACLVMVAKSVGLDYPLHYIDSLCDTQSEGVSLISLETIAQSLGFDTLAVKIAENRLQDLSLPAILHWNQNHFIVLYRISSKGNKFHILDPAKGRITLSKDSFIKGWANKFEDETSPCGIALMLEKKEQANTIYEEYKKSIKINQNSSLRKLICKNISEYKIYLLQIFVGLFLTCLFQLSFPFLTQAIVDKGIFRNNLNVIYLILVGECLIIIAKTLTDFIRRWLLLHLSTRINIKLITEFVEKLFHLPMRFFDSRRLGDIIQRMEDNRRIQTFISTQSLSVTFNIFSIIIFGIVLSIYSFKLFMIFIIFSVLYCVWIILFLDKRRQIDYELFSTQGENQTVTYQLLSTMQETKLQGCGTRRRWEWEDAQAELFDVSMKNLKLQQTIEAGAIGINELKNILITVLAATSVINGHLTLGAMLAIQFIIGQMNSPIAQIMDFIYAIQDLKISFDRVNEVKLINDEDAADTQKLIHPIFKIELKDVSFKYHKFSSFYTLKDISLSLKRGKTTAIVGASGCGKTTLIKLLLGYYPLENGNIKINDTDFRTLSVSEWRKHCGIVMQEGVIYNDTIIGNICMHDDDMNYERFQESLRIAGIKEFVDALPLKETTKIGPSGKGLSIGQKQRILIARAVYRMPEVLIFDEATNSLDATNERLVVENLKSYYHNRIVLLIAHRLSTIKDADEILVMDNGRIIERGNYQYLINRKGRFYQLVKNQIELELIHNYKGDKQ